MCGPIAGEDTRSSVDVSYTVEQDTKNPDSTEARNDRLSAAQEDTGVKLFADVDVTETVDSGFVVGFGRVNDIGGDARGEEPQRVVIVQNADGELIVAYPRNLSVNQSVPVSDF
jgi:hypothetical protein